MSLTVVTCRTEGCSNADQPVELDLTWTDEDGVEHQVDAVHCGVCGQPIDERDTPP
jgi:hypothetical protein